MNGAWLTTAVPGPWQTWTPTLSGRLDDADWTKSCRFIQIGKTVHFTVSLTAAAAAPAGGGAGEFTISLPVTTISYGGTATLQPIGEVMLNDATGTRWEGSLYWASTTTAVIRYRNVSGTGIVNAACSATVPFTWTTSDEILIKGLVEAA